MLAVLAATVLLLFALIGALAVGYMLAGAALRRHDARQERSERR